MFTFLFRFCFLYKVIKNGRFCKSKFAFEAKHAPYELDIFSLPAEGGGPSPTVEGECRAFKSAIAYSLRILLPSPKGATFLPEEGIDRGTDFAIKFSFAY